MDVQLKSSGLWNFMLESNIPVIHEFVETSVATDTTNMLDAPSVFLFFFPNKFALLTFATHTNNYKTFSCQSCNSSPSKSLWGCDHAMLKPYFAIFLFFFLSFESRKPLSFLFPLLLSASYEDSQYKCNSWSYLQIYKLKEKKYYGWLLGRILKWKHAWTGQGLVKQSRKDWTCLACLRLKVKPLALTGAKHLAYLVPVHGVFLLQLTLSHRLIFFLIFLQLFGWDL